ncbi:MAG: hypothetical protein COA57_16030 [Flavobacteriales bacterium]|nr:MAG: hypothetical protein COA57_16030 [Flavobacteriales bacterium]
MLQHYQDENGRWQEIDLNIVNDGKQFSNISHEVKSYYPFLAGNSGVNIVKGQNRLEIWSNPNIKIIDDLGNVLRTINTNQVNGEAKDEILLYKDAYLGMDEKFTVMLEGLENEIVVNYANDSIFKISTSTDILFSQTIKFSGSDYSIYDDSQQEKKESFSTKRVMFRNGDETVFQLLPIIVFDNTVDENRAKFLGNILCDYLLNPNKDESMYDKLSDEDKYILSNNILLSDYFVDFTNDGVEVSYKLPVNWFTSPSRQFPVTIDPTWTYASATGWYYSPYHIYYNYSRTQSIYLSSDLGFSGDITKIEYWSNGNSFDVLNTSQHWLNDIAYSSFSSGTWQATGTLVWSGNLSISAVNNFVGHPGSLTTTFTHNNANNLLISYRHQDGSWESGYSVYSGAGTGTNRSLFGRSDVSNPPGVGLNANVNYCRLTYTSCSTPANPGNPTSNSPQCADVDVTITRSGSPPAGVTWYWQSTSCGTSTGFGSGATYTATSSGTYYIRARDNVGLCWSAGCGSVAVTVNANPANPGNPTSNSPQCADVDVTITRSGSPPAGVTWYWQGTSCGTSTGLGSGTTYTATSSGTYYIRARNNTSLCWSTTCGSVAVIVNPNPAAPGNPTSSANTCGDKTLTRSGSPPAGVTWYWEGTSCGTSTGLGSGATYTATSSGTYYIRARDNTSLCWSTSCGSLAVTVNPIPADPPAPTPASNPACDNTVLNTMTPPGGITYYWQGTSCGTSTASPTSSTYPVSSTATYYVRARNNTSGCWSTACGSVSVTVNVSSIAPAGASASPSSIPVGNSSTLTFSGGSLGTGGSWQWYTGGCGVTGAGSGTSITVSPTVTTTYYVRAEGTCNNTSCVSVTVTVSSFPTGVVLNGGKAYISGGTYVYINGGTSGDFINLTSGTNQGSIENNGTMKVEGDWTNDATASNVFSTVTGTVEHIGSAAQTIGGATSTNFNNMTINNTITGNGGVTINTNATVNGTLTLTDGHLIAPVVGRLTLETTASCSPARGSATSFVSGAMDRKVNAIANYDFPLGSSPDSRWRPITITTKDATARTWTIDFKDDNPVVTYGSTIKTGEVLTGMNSDYYYDISRTNTPASADVKMWYEDADLAAWGISELEVLIGHWDAGNAWWDNWGKNTQADWVRDATNNWVQCLNVGTFSPGGPGDDGGALPVELMNFESECNENSIELHWITATEINSDYFTVKRSCDGVSYESIGTISAAGNTSQQSSYVFVDEEFPSVTCYYMLSQTDFDGTTTTLAKIAVLCKQDNNIEFGLITVFPNPSSETVNITYQSSYNDEVSMRILDVLGREIITKRATATEGVNNFIINMETHANGIYYLELGNGRKLFVEKIVKTQ